MSTIRLIIVTSGFLLVLACSGASTATPIPTLPPTPTATVQPTPTDLPTTIPEPPAWRYVNSGWISPYNVGVEGAFQEELRVFVITSQDELDSFNQTIATKISRGTTTSLGRIDFADSIILTAYYLWRPLQGDPLSVAGFSVEGSRATVDLEMEEAPQGREYPYLLAPMTMVTVSRSLLPSDEPIEFVFQLNGEPKKTLSVRVN